MTMSFAVATAVAIASVTWSPANSVATGDQDGPAVAANRTGGVAVVWEDDRDTANPGNNDHSEIYLRFYRDGAPVYEKKLSAGGTSGTNWKHLTPDVGLDDRGNAVVVWADDPDGNGSFNVPYRIVSPSGAVLAAGRANANADGNQILPRVAVDPDGAPGNAAAVAFSVVWEDVQGAAVTVKAAGFTGTATKAYEKVASQTAGKHHRPDVAVAAGGDATVAWEQDADGDGSFDIGLTRLARANGAVLLAPRAANGNLSGQQRRPAIATDLIGEFALSWESNHSGTAGVWARSFTPAAAGRHPEVQVAAGGAAPTIGVDDQGVAVVGWTAGGVDGWLAGLNTDGSTEGRLVAQRLTETTTGRQDQFAVGVSPWAEVAVCYTDDHDGNAFDQVMLGFGATNNDGDWLRRMAALREARTAVRVPPETAPGMVPAAADTYYASAQGKTGDKLKDALHGIISSGVTTLSYDAVWNALKVTDQDPANSSNVILLYSGTSRSKSRNGGSAGDWNREHVWAKSHGGFGTAAGPGTDLHHLRPEDVQINAARDNKDFDNGGTAVPGATGNRTDADSWEPRAAVRGDVARMIFYMAVRYEGGTWPDLEIDDATEDSADPRLGRLSALLKWHAQDPPDAFEIRRNDTIYRTYQHNRNPFIDHPEWAGAVFG